MQEFTTFISNHSTLSSIAAILLVLLIIVEFIRNQRSRFKIGPAQMIQLINHHHAVVIDVRPTDLYRKGHVIDALSLSAEEIKTHPKKIEKFKTKPLILICNTGMDSQKIAAQLLKQGYNAYVLTNGLRAWTAADMPLVKE